MLYSPEDDILIKSHKWRMDDWYAVTSVKSGNKYKTQRCHRMILGITDPNIIVDHKNGDELDNQRENLRIATSEENGRNRAKVKKGSKFQYKGIEKDRNSFGATIRVNGKGFTRGHFKTEEEAARLYDSMAIHFYGEFARLNFPDEVPYKFEEWLAELEVKKAEKSKNTQERNLIINEILNKNSKINVRLIKEHLEQNDLDLSWSNRYSFHHALNKMVTSGQLGMEKIAIDINNSMNNYFKIQS